MNKKWLSIIFSFFFCLPCIGQKKITFFNKKFVLIQLYPTYERGSNIVMHTDSSITDTPRKVDVFLSDIKSLNFISFSAIANPNDTIRIFPYNVNGVLIQGILSYLKLVQPYIDNSSSKYFSLSVLTAKKIVIKNKIDTATVASCKLDLLDFSSSAINHIFRIRNSTIDSLKLTNCSLPQKIEFVNVDFVAGLYPIDLTTINYKSPIFISLKNVTGADFIFNPEKIQFIIEKDQPFDVKASTYKAILKRIDKSIYLEEYGYYDRQYQELKLLKDGHPIINFIEKYWWGYGYDGARVFQASTILFLIIILINLTCFSYLRKVYCPEKINIFMHKVNLRYSEKSAYRKMEYYLSHGLACVLYSSYIFWGLRLDIEKIHLKYWLFILLIVLEYILGIISLAYIAHYILVK